MEDENLCDGCVYCGQDCNKRPCNTCIQWVEGYLEAVNYEPLKSVV